MSMFFVYILYSKKFDKYYIGQTKDVEKRFDHHNKGLDRFTRKYVPWELAFYITKESLTQALQLEKKLKNLSRARLQEFMVKYGVAR